MTTFDAFYEAIYSKRWPTLQEALLKPVNPISLRCGYRLDPASLLPARALEVEPGMKVLDLCAAPGGKTLAICETVSPDQMEHHVNEMSKDRFHRLRAVLKEFLGESHETRIRYHCARGEVLFKKFLQTFDRILVDAPCSSERHLLAQPKELAKWSPRRSRTLAIKQYALLSSAWLMLKQGGILVYATCSLSPTENEELIKRFLKKKESEAILMEFTDPQLEPRDAGAIVLPDRGGTGPIYLAKLKKSL